MSEQCTEHMPDAYARRNALSICTDGRTDGRTYGDDFSPTRDNNSSVTRTRAYGDVSLADFEATS